MMLQGLPGLKWDGRVVSTAIKYVQTVRYMWVEIVFRSEGVFAWGFSIFNLSSDDSSLQERS